MTNKEFYGDKLLAIVLEDVCHKLYKGVHGESCRRGIQQRQVFRRLGLQRRRVQLQRICQRCP